MHPSVKPLYNPFYHETPPGELSYDSVHNQMLHRYNILYNLSLKKDLEPKAIIEITNILHKEGILGGFDEKEEEQKQRKKDFLSHTLLRLYFSQMKCTSNMDELRMRMRIIPGKQLSQYNDREQSEIFKA